MVVYLPVDTHVQGSSTSKLLQESPIPPLDVAEEGVDGVDVANRLFVQLLPELDVGGQEPINRWELASQLGKLFF